MNLVTGAAGFIGSHFIASGGPFVVLDKLTYAADASRVRVPNVLVRGDICDRELVADTIQKYRPEWIIHFAAESHVTRSIENPSDFVRTNVVGTTVLLEEAVRAGVKFLHISTDEVYGDLAPDALPSSETSVYAPRNPYAASKAASDVLVRSFVETYGMQAIVTHCGNNYGPGQHAEKLIPYAVDAILNREPVHIHGSGEYLRDWIHVEDHCAAILLLMTAGTFGETYNIGAGCERTNLWIVRELARLMGREPKLKFVADRAAQDKRYAINATKIRALGWRPQIEIEAGLKDTISSHIALEAA